VGSSCIYPLLGTVTRPNWRFFGTEMDTKSFAYAQRNVSANDLESRIRLYKVSHLDQLLPLDKLGARHLDFVMCNPPFYESREDMLASWSSKSSPPSAICTGADVEMITEGGDAGFATRMVQESTEHQGRVQWFTCMLGKLTSLGTVVAALRNARCRNWAVGVLSGGGKTRRWVIGWSWSGFRPLNVSDIPGVCRADRVVRGGRVLLSSDMPKCLSEVN
jgi:23S rRNA (adenine1618-N6)-methyltransferase